MRRIGVRPPVDGTVSGFSMLKVALAGLGYAAYVPTDITSEICANHDLISQYLRDVTGTMISDSYIFTVTVPGKDART